MQLEIKNCQNCKQNFTIESDDFAFYDKMKARFPDYKFNVTVKDWSSLLELLVSGPE